MIKITKTIKGKKLTEIPGEYILPYDTPYPTIENMIIYLNPNYIHYNRIFSMSKREEILKYLEKHTSLSMMELHLLTGLPPSSIRARISELKKIGYHISHEPITSEKYILQPGNPLLSFLEKNNLFNRPFSIKQIAKSLNTTTPALQLEIAKLFKEYRIMQLSSDSILIKKG